MGAVLAGSLRMLLMVLKGCRERGHASGSVLSLLVRTSYGLRCRTKTYRVQGLGFRGLGVYGFGV